MLTWEGCQTYQTLFAPYMSPRPHLMATSWSFAQCFVDTDFAGHWHQAYSHLCDSTLSCTQYILVYCGCPISWTSKLQTKIALSMTEAEYQALSTCMHIQELSAHSFIDDMMLSRTWFFSGQPKLDIFEDNQSCLTITNSEAVQLQTKHLSIKYHHFWDQVLNGTVWVVKVHTNDNWVDIFTKPLSCIKFECLCQMLMGL